MKAIPAFAAALLVLALGQAAPASTASGPTATASRTAHVDMVNFAFRPGTLNIGRGTKVVFSNTSSRPHTATRRGVFDTGRVKPGGRASITFNRRGTFGYFCKIHPEMRGRIVVN
jgi:plastocyanin